MHHGFSLTPGNRILAVQPTFTALYSANDHSSRETEAQTTAQFVLEFKVTINHKSCSDVKRLVNPFNDADRL